MTAAPSREPGPVPVFRLFYAFVPDTSLLCKVRFQIVAVSRAMSEIGQEAVFYGALVAVADDPMHASLIAIGKAVPAAAFGLVGGAVADALPRRIALGLGYGLQAAACLAVLLFLSTKTNENSGAPDRTRTCAPGFGGQRSIRLSYGGALYQL